MAEHTHRRLFDGHRFSHEDHDYESPAIDGHGHIDARSLDFYPVIEDEEPTK